MTPLGCSTQANNSADTDPGIESVIKHEETGQAQFIQQTASQLRRLRLKLPALIALEMGHPFTFMSSQFLIISQPFLSLFMPSRVIRQFVNLLEEPAAVRALMYQLESEQE